jgi:hypothetical protein
VAVPMTEATPALQDRPSIAVLPFQSLSDDPEQEYFADGVVEEIITGLVGTTEGNHHPKHNEIPVVAPRPKSLRAIGASPAVRGQIPKAKSWAAHLSVNLHSTGARSLGSLGAFAKRWIGVLCASRLELNGHRYPTVRSPQT